MTRDLGWGSAFGCLVPGQQKGGSGCAWRVLSTWHHAQRAQGKTPAANVHLQPPCSLHLTPVPRLYLCCSRATCRRSWAVYPGQSSCTCPTSDSFRR